MAIRTTVRTSVQQFIKRGIPILKIDMFVTVFYVSFLQVTVVRMHVRLRDVETELSVRANNATMGTLTTGEFTRDVAEYFSNHKGTGCLNAAPPMSNTPTNSDACRNDCMSGSCGDGIIQAGEECDDGNTVDDDSCTNLCRNPRVSL